jgi:hypothetical protein
MAQLKSETKTIGENQYTVTVLPVQSGREAMIRLQRIMAGGIGAITTGSRSDIPAALAGVSERLTAGDLEWFCSTFGKATKVCTPPDETAPNGRTLILAESDAQTLVFAGNYLEMFKWLEFCIELNFGSLLEKIKGALASPAPAPVVPATGK